MSDLILSEFYKGIADSPHLGIGDMRNLNTNIPGVVTLNNQLTSDLPTPFSNVPIVSVNTGLDTLQVAASAVGTTWPRAVTFTTTGTLPSPLVPGTTYWLADRGAGNTLVSVCTDYQHTLMAGGTYIDLTDAGTGTHYITSVDPGELRGMTDNGAGRLFAFDEYSKLWTRATTAGNKWVLLQTAFTGISVGGIAFWKNYLLFTAGTKLGYCGPLNSETSLGSYTADLSWKTDVNYTAGQTQQMLVGQDNILYWLGSHYVGSLLEIPTKTFSPTDATTYNENAKALDFPLDKTATCFVEMTYDLLIGTNKGAYAWNRRDESFKYPVLKTLQINAAVNFNSVVYLFVGNRNDIYVTDGSTAELVKKFPESLLGAQTSTIKPHAVGVFDNKIYFALFGTSSASLEGIWSFDPFTKFLKLEHALNGSTYGETIGAFYSFSNTDFAVGWSYGGTAYASSIGTPSRYTSYLGYLISPLYPVGLPLVKRTFKSLEISLDRPLATGQGVRVSYRSHLSDTFTTVATFDFASYGAQLSQEFPFSMATNLEYLQLKVELTTGSSSTTTPFLKEIRVR